MPHRHGFHAALLTLLASLPLAAGAQTQRSSAPNAQVLQQLQQLASERTALQAENARLKAELDKTKKERDGAKQAQGAAEQRARQTQAQGAAGARNTADVQRLEAELARDRERTQELVARFRETATTLRDVETDRNGARQQLAQREVEIKTCTERNGALYALNGEILTRFEADGFWSAVAQREPFTQIKRNQLENLVDGYRLKAADQKVGPAP